MSENTVVLNEEKPKKPKIFEGFFNKIKKIKHLDIILTVLFIAVILLIYFSGVSGKNSNEKEGDASLINLSISAYASSLEDKLEEVIGSIKDAGKVSVLVYFDKGIETIIAYNIDKKSSSDGTSSETKTPVLITNNGKTEVIVLQELMPEPSSILIVATGASKTNVKLEILRAVQAMFKISTSNIEIFAGN